MSENLPPFPVDDMTLDAVEHSLGAVLTYDRPEGNVDFSDEGPWVIGADYQLHKLLDFYSGTMDDEGVVLLPKEEWIDNAPTTLDERQHYTERDVIRALINEVRRLRNGAES